MVTTVRAVGTVRAVITEPRLAWDAAAVAALRRRLGLTQTQLATRLGVRDATIWEWESGRYPPRGPCARLLDVLAAETSASTGGRGGAP